MFFYFVIPTFVMPTFSRSSSQPLSNHITIQFFFFFSRYATEVDVDFVRKSVRAIGRCAIKVEVLRINVS